MSAIIAWLQLQLLRILSIFWKPILRFVIYPLKKLFLPIIDAKYKIEQSRMRYLLIQFSFPDGGNSVAYQEINSNGEVLAYRRLDGRRYFPPDVHEASVAGNKQYQFPKWAKIDWKDIFSGELNSGCWGIVNK